MLHDPEHVLVVYGSLKPGEMNHHHVADIEGEWVDGVIKGEMGKWRQYLRFARNTQNPQKVEVKVLISVKLPQHWSRLDEFEGEAYKRVLCDVETEHGTISGYVYAKP
jgi:gamma-glutamylcyclotransferase (GGCT)/AIG2-like uncharacterized protein YtfP